MGMAFLNFLSWLFKQRRPFNQTRRAQVAQVMEMNEPWPHERAPDFSWSWKEVILVLKIPWQSSLLVVWAFQDQSDKNHAGGWNAKTQKRRVEGERSITALIVNVFIATSRSPNDFLFFFFPKTVSGNLLSCWTSPKSVQVRSAGCL